MAEALIQSGQVTSVWLTMVNLLDFPQTRLEVCSRRGRSDQATILMALD